MLMCGSCIFQALVWLLVANGAPIIAGKMLGKRGTRPLDNGLVLRDGHRLFGDKKTWRGVFSAIFLTALMATLEGREPLTGALFGALAMAGDLLASFIKRRRGNAESSRARGLDTVPESVLPLYLLKEPLGLGLIDIMLSAGLFFLIEEFVSPILYKLHIRNQPY